MSSDEHGSQRLTNARFDIPTQTTPTSSDIFRSIFHAIQIGLTPPIGDLVTVCNILSQCKGLVREAAKGFVSRPLRRKRGGGLHCYVSYRPTRDGNSAVT